MARPFWLTKLLVRSGVARVLPSVRRLTDGGGEYLRYYSDAVLAAPLDDLRDPAFFPGPPGPDVVDLNLAAPVVEPHGAAGRVGADRRADRAPWGTAELRGAVADLYVRRDGRAVDPDTQLVVTHGATAAYAAALTAFVNPGDRVVLLDPCPPMFALGAKSRRASVRWVPTWNDGGRCRYPAADFERAMRGAKLLVLSDVGNPTGASLSPDDLDHLAWIAASYDVLVYLDESFTRFRPDGRGLPLATRPGAEKRVVTAGSVSQGWGLGAARVGWLAGPKHLVRACGLVANLNAPYVSPVCQGLAARAIATPDADFAPALEQLRTRRRYVCDRLKAMGLEPEWPAGGYFAWVPVASTGLDGRTFAARALKEHKVLVGPGCAFGPGGGGHVRVSFAADDGRVREGLARLAAFVASLRDPTPVMVEGGAETPAENADEATKPVFSRV